MTDEEKKAIEELTEIKELVEEDLKYKDYRATAILDQIDLESLVIVLNLIEKQNKIINEMAESYATCKTCLKYDCKKRDKNAKECIIKYFENKAEEN